MLTVTIPGLVFEKEPLFKEDAFVIETYGYIERMSSLVALVNGTRYIFDVTIIEDDDRFKEADLINIKEPVNITLKRYCGNAFIVDNIESIQTEDHAEIGIDDSDENIDVASIRGSNDTELVKTESDTQVETEATQTNESKPNKRCHGTSGPSYKPKKIMF
jgi:hypothetical protein